MYVIDLVKTVITAEHGWAVADQFEATFNGQPFEEQNDNALRYIKMVVNDILHSRLLNENAQEELQEYKDELENYMLGGQIKSVYLH